MVQIQAGLFKSSSRVSYGVLGRLEFILGYLVRSNILETTVVLGNILGVSRFTPGN